jgi:4-cresol dehydrogenase (hydroxylating)
MHRSSEGGGNGSLKNDSPLRHQSGNLTEFVARVCQVLSDDQIVLESAEVSRRAAVTQHRSFAPRIYLYPSCSAELSHAIKVANQLSVPVYVLSKGRNWGYGAATVTPETSVCIVLERMNRIIRVDPILAYAVVEPGVSYRELYQHLSEHYPDLWIDCTDSTPDGSVIGNALERGIGFTTYGDHYACLCGMEVMLADGSIIRTGASSDEHSPAFHCHKWGTGPILEGLFSQSNFGIVLNAGIWLMPRPDYHLSVMGDIQRFEDVFPTLDRIRELQLEGTIQAKVHIANEIVNLAVFAREDVAEITGPLQENQVSAIRRKYGIASWTFAFSIYGTKLQVKASQQRIKQKLQATTSLHFANDNAIRRLKAVLPWSRRFPVVTRLLRARFGKAPEVLGIAEKLHSVMKGIPTEFLLKHGYFRNHRRCPASDVDPARDGCGLTWFAPVIPTTGQDLQTLIDITRPLFEHYGMDYYLAVLSLNSRCCVTLLSIFYQQEVAASRERAENLYKELLLAVQDAGYQQYRTGTLGSESLYRHCPEYGQLLSRIKTSVDPEGILSPGKYGISLR